MALALLKAEASSCTEFGHPRPRFCTLDWKAVWFSVNDTKMNISTVHNNQHKGNLMMQWFGQVWPRLVWMDTPSIISHDHHHKQTDDEAGENRGFQEIMWPVQTFSSFLTLCGSHYLSVKYCRMTQQWSISQLNFGKFKLRFATERNDRWGLTKYRPPRAGQRQVVTQQRSVELAMS
jgi:hypothetical protein